MVFCQTGGGGGSARLVKKPYCFFEKVFFQRACRIILGPPKHVLHLVWSPYVIYTAIRIALKVAWKARILGKRRSISKNKKIKFGMGPNVKFVSPICDLISKRKNRGNFFIRKKTIPGGVRGGVWQKTIKNTGFFRTPSLMFSWLGRW